MAKAKARKPAAPKPAPPAPDEPLRLVWMSPAELTANPGNWRTHPQHQIDALSDVIAEVGWAGVCLWNSLTNRLVDGHARKNVALAKGIEKVPVLVGNWTEEQERLILATLDPIAAQAEADGEALASLLAGVSTDSGPINELLASLATAAGIAPDGAAGGGGDDFDATPEDAGPTRTKLGEVWVLKGDGREHRLLVGDCTVKENVARLMGGAKVGLCFTSPPYAQQRDYGAKITDWDALMRGAFAHLPMEDAGQVLVNLGLVHRDGEWVPYWDGWIAWMREQGWRRFGWYVWDQGFGLPGDWQGRLAPSFEFVFHFNRAAIRPEKWVGKQEGSIKARSGQSIMRKANGAPVKSTNAALSLQPTKVPDSVIRVMRQQGGLGNGLDHPAVYPVGLPEFAMQSWPGTVYDPFGGSGTTLIAAHRQGRSALLCELEPKFADVILKRASAEGLSCEREA